MAGSGSSDPKQGKAYNKVTRHTLMFKIPTSNS